jgi:hypothetical protein
MRTLLVPITALLLAAGCSSGSTRTVSGQLDLTQMHPQNAQVLAISSSGRVFRAPISATGSFAISLPTNAKYTLRFANATNVASRYDAFATLKPRRAAGAQTHWFAVTSGSAINLGRVGRVGTLTPQTAGIKPQSDGADDTQEGADDQSGDDGQEDDGASACDVQNGQDDVDVESENDVNDSADSDKDGQPDSVDTDNNNGTCNVATQDGECELNDDQGQELDDEADKSCTTGGGTGTPAPTPAPGVAG